MGRVNRTRESTLAQERAREREREREREEREREMSTEEQSTASLHHIT
jgi:hypothetical protein